MNLPTRGARGFAVLGAIIIVLIIVALGGGAYYAAQRAETKAAAEIDGDLSLRELLDRGDELTCTFTQKKEGTKTAGVVYMADGHARGDFTSEVEGQAAVVSHMVHDGEYAYVWSDAMASQGFKVKADAAADAEAKTQGAVGLDDTVNFDCEEWDEDDSKFSLPDDVTFADVSSMGAMASTSAAANMNVGASGAGANASAGANVNAGGTAAQCASCDALPDSAKTQCRAALGC